MSYGKAVFVFESVDGWPSIITARILKKVTVKGVEKDEDVAMPQEAIMKIVGDVLVVSVDLNTVTSRNNGGSQIRFELSIGGAVITSVAVELKAKDSVWTKKRKVETLAEDGDWIQKKKNKQLANQKRRMQTSLDDLQRMKRILSEVQWSPNFFGSSPESVIFYYCQICLGRKTAGHESGCRLSELLGGGRSK